VLKAENKAYLKAMQDRVTPLIKWRLGLAGIVLAITGMMAAYIAMTQPRIVRNTTRSLAIAVLLVMMLLLAQLAAIAADRSTCWIGPHHSGGHDSVHRL